VTGSPDVVVPTTIRPQVGQRRAEGEDRHDLAGRGDVEAGLPGYAVHPDPEPDHHVAQRPVVDVEHAAPDDVARVEPGRAAVVEVVVHDGGQQVVGGGHGVEVAGQVQVDPLHRHDLAVPTTGRAALDPERRPHRRLAEVHHRPRTAEDQPLGEPDARRGLALAQRGGRDRGDHDVLRSALRTRRHAVEHGEIDLGDAATVVLEMLLSDADVGRDVGDGTQGGGLGDLETAGHRDIHGPCIPQSGPEGNRHKVTRVRALALRGPSEPGMKRPGRCRRGRQQRPGRRRR
jgi:hypothetical protein